MNKYVNNNISDYSRAQRGRQFTRKGRRVDDPGGVIGRLQTALSKDDFYQVCAMLEQAYMAGKIAEGWRKFDEQKGESGG